VHPGRTDRTTSGRAGHYERKLQTKAGEVKVRIPKLGAQTFETAIIERYRRRESSVVRLVISDACMGLAESAVLSRCRLAKVVSSCTGSNIFSHVPSTKVREIAAMLKAIHAGEDIATARQKAVQARHGHALRRLALCARSSAAAGGRGALRAAAISRGPHVLHRPAVTQGVHRRRPNVVCAAMNVPGSDEGNPFSVR
jgi:transposase-like protein